MKRVLVLGAGRSTPYLVDRLLAQAPARGWTVTVADADRALAERRVAGRPHGTALALDAGDEQQLALAIGAADLVVNILAPRFQAAVARLSIDAGVPSVSVSYLQPDTRALEARARERGVLVLTEIGLDPGIDHMMAADAVRRARSRGGRIRSLRSWGAGVAALGSVSNPLGYLVTWNPWNVATAGAAGAQYLLDGQLRVVPHERLFHHPWPVDVDGVGRLEGYPNRDCLSYVESFAIPEVRTMIRGTLRHPGFCAAWSAVVRLGLSNATVEIPRLGERSPREVVRMLLPVPVPLDRVESATTLFLGLNPAGHVLACLRFLGLFDPEPTGCPGSTAADLLTWLLAARLAPSEESRDTVILAHDMEVELPGAAPAVERQRFTLVEHGQPARMSAMATTVGLPAALAVEMIAAGELPLSGVHIPTHPAVCGPILERLRGAGLGFEETVEPVAAGTRQ